MDPARCARCSSIPPRLRRDCTVRERVAGAGPAERRQRQHRDHGDGLRADVILRDIVDRSIRCAGRVRARPCRRVEPRVWYNPELRSALFLVPGLIAYIAMITAVVSTALSIVREKERGTMEQVRMAPLSTLAVRRRQDDSVLLSSRCGRRS